MSYAAEVKKELTCLEVHKEHAKAELAALRSENTRMTQEIHQNMEVVSRAEASARQF